MMASEGAQVPAGVSAETATGAPGEAPAERRERGIRALDVGSRLLAGATTFFFLAFAFAYFYLRSLNVEHLWRHGHLKPNQALGAAFIACVVISALLAVLAAQRERRDMPWTAPGALAVVLGLAAIALQCIEYTKQNFGPTNGAFASVFCAWTGFYLIAVLGTMYWLETQVATELRERRKPTARPGEGTALYEDPDKLLQRGLNSAVFYWAFLAFIGVITYVILYLL
jgi:heme/copper-type cytochrome/quinol oxidase subunit 3